MRISVDKGKLIEHLGLCVSLAKEERVKQVLQNLKQDLEDGEFDDVPTLD